MGIIHGSYYSKYLNQQQKYVAVMPEILSENTQVIFLLHGIQSDERAWLLNSDLEHLAEKYDASFFCPAAGNSFYTRHNNGEDYGRAIGEEFYEKMHQVFQLTKDRSKNKLVGFSMGGYGALRLGFLYPDQYASIGAFSPALVFYKKERNEPHFNFVFANGLEKSENDPLFLFEKLSKDTQEKINICLRCGNQDPLDKPTQEFYEGVKSTNPKTGISYQQTQGFHDFGLWRNDLEQFLINQ